MNSQISNIIKELKEVQQLVEKLEKSGILPRIELDIAMSNLQQIYNALLQFSSLETPEHVTFSNTDGSKIKETVTAKQEHKISKSSIPEPENAAKEIKEKKNEADKTIEQTIKSQVTDDELMQIEDPVTKAEIENKPEIKKAAHSEHKEAEQSIYETHIGKEILAERYRKNQKYINELLAQGYHKQDISGLMQSKPIKDIEAAIGINEKFLFIRELFSGDEETYLKTVRILNNSANFNEAFNYIHTTFNWNLEGDAAQKLLDLVRRRFIVDED